MGVLGKWKCHPCAPDYFIDGKGRIRFHHFGDGEYDKSERVIQTLLRENGATGLDESLVRICVFR